MTGPLWAPVESFNVTLKQTALLLKLHAIKVVERFDKNLNVTSKNINFFVHCLRDNLARVACVPKGAERKRMLGARERRKGNTFLSSLLPYGVHLRTKIIENKIQFEVQKLDYPCRNLVI